MPIDYRELARLTGRLVAHAGSGTDPLSPDHLLTLFEKSDAFRRRERFERGLLATRALVDVDPRISEALAALGGIALSEAERHGLKGPQIAGALRTKRLAALQSVLTHSEPRRS